MIRKWHEERPNNEDARSLLDICCGTGELAHHFLKNGYRVTGVDVSADMLRYAKDLCSDFIKKGQAGFIQSGAVDFKPEDKYALVTATSDAVNHLDSIEDVHLCFKNAYDAAVDGAHLILDMITAKQLKRWDRILVDDSVEASYIRRGVYAEAIGRAITRMTGFFLEDNGLYSRYDTVLTYSIFRVADVVDALKNAGWASLRVVDKDDLERDVAEPEKEKGVFITAVK